MIEYLYYIMYPNMYSWGTVAKAARRLNLFFSSVLGTGWAMRLEFEYPPILYFRTAYSDYPPELHYWEPMDGTGEPYL